MSSGAPHGWREHRLCGPVTPGAGVVLPRARPPAGGRFRPLEKTGIPCPKCDDERVIWRLLAQARGIGIPRTRRLARLAGRGVAIVTVAMLGGWLGLVVGGQTTSPIGPVDTRLSLRPALTGDTIVNIAPLGSLWLDSHDGLLQLRIAVDQVRADDALHLLKHPISAEAFGDRIAEDLRLAVTGLVIKSAVSMLLGASLLALLVFRRPGRTGLSALVATVMIVATTAVSVSTFTPSSIAEPRYRGLLSSAPSLVGNVQHIVQNFTEYSAQLGHIVTNVSQVYTATSALPTYQPDPGTVRVLHVSDIHLNPAAWDVIHSLTKQFKIDVIVDSGDLTDQGSAPETQFVDEISTFDVPYVYVRGNHDSRRVQEAVADQDAIVLDREKETVAGLTFYGVGDPRFTPDLSAGKTGRKYTTAKLATLGRSYARQLRGHNPSVDVAVAHGPAVARGFDGAAPLVLAGHAHKRSTKLLPRGTRLFVQGSTGGAGLRGLDHNKPTPLQCSVLYFNRKTDRLQAWDNITVGGLGLTSARIQRHINPPAGRRMKAPPTSSSSAPSPTAPATAAPSSPPQGSR